MDYDSQDFNGEIIAKLPTNFRIPMKSTPKTATANLKDNVADDCKNTDSKENYTSPLQQIETDLSSALSAQKTFDGNNSRKRKQQQQQPPPPAAASSEVSPENNKRAAYIFFGRHSHYPDALNQLIQQFNCDLCEARFTSRQVANDHYDSRKHVNRVKEWLTKWSNENGEAIPKIPKLNTNEATAGPDAYHCEVCDLALTSLQHANQHYNGKKHKLVLANISKPSGSGYYDANGKWIRTPTNIKTDSRFGIGASFYKPIEDETQTAPKAVKEKPKDQDTRCEICKIEVTSKSEMQLHLQGSKHAKKLKLLGQPPNAPVNDTLLASVQAMMENDLSMYRTPSGQYYCKTCDLTLDDQFKLKQHLGGKRHIKNMKKVN